MTSNSTGSVPEFGLTRFFLGVALSRTLTRTGQIRGGVNAACLQSVTRVSEFCYQIWENLCEIWSLCLLVSSSVGTAMNLGLILTSDILRRPRNLGVCCLRVPGVVSHPETVMHYHH